MTTPPAGAPLRLVIADDQASVRQGLVLLLNAVPDIEVVGAAADGSRPWTSWPSTTPTRSCSTCGCPSWTASAPSVG